MSIGETCVYIDALQEEKKLRYLVSESNSLNILHALMRQSIYSIWHLMDASLEIS